MNYPESPSPTYKDRRTALLVAGVLEIILGAAAWLMLALMFLGASLAAGQGQAKVTSMIPGMAMYGLAGVVFVVLGIGSIRARRWARALWLVVSVSWLMVGILGLGTMLLLLPGMFQGAGAGPQPPPGLQTVILVVVGSFFTVFMIALPTGLLLFYRSPHVQATCEADNPEPCWTDHCALPVLGASLWLASMALTLPWMGLAYGGLYPFFGVFVRGFAGHGFWIASGLVSAVAAFGVYRHLKPVWWLAVLFVIAQGVSASVTYALADLRQLYEGMGIGGLQLEQLERMGMMRPSYMIATTLAAILPLLALLLWARTCFPADAGPHPSSVRPPEGEA